MTPQRPLVGEAGDTMTPLTHIVHIHIEHKYYSTPEVFGVRRFLLTFVLICVSIDVGGNPNGLRV